MIECYITAVLLSVYEDRVLDPAMMKYMDLSAR